MNPAFVRHFFVASALLSLSALVEPGFSQGPVADGPPAATAAISPAVSTPGMQRQFGGLYTAWRDAMDKKDFEAWKQVTAQSRQGEIRNRIVSQRLSYPQALFDSPISAPALEGLLHVGTLVRGDTASSVYFGKADFGISDPTAVRDNFIVLRFVREFDVWKYDNLRVVKFGDDAEVLLKIRNNDLSFLQSPEFLPDAEVPPIPGPVQAPEYLAEVWITAIGYEVTITVNARHTSVLANDQGRELIIGGLDKGSNRVAVEVKEIPFEGGTPRHLEIGIYGAKQAADKAERYYHFRSSPESPPENYETTFPVPRP